MTPNIFFWDSSQHKGFLAVVANFCWVFVSDLSHIYCGDAIAGAQDCSQVMGAWKGPQLQHCLRVRETAYVVHGGNHPGASAGESLSPITLHLTSSASYPCHWHLVGLHIEMGCPHLIQSPIVQFLQGQTSKEVIWPCTWIMKNHEGKWAIACGPEEYDGDAISLYS